MIYNHCPLGSPPLPKNFQLSSHFCVNRIYFPLSNITVLRISSILDAFVSKLPDPTTPYFIANLFFFCKIGNANNFIHHNQVITCWHAVWPLHMVRVDLSISWISTPAQVTINLHISRRKDEEPLHSVSIATLYCALRHSKWSLGSSNLVLSLITINSNLF